MFKTILAAVDGSARTAAVVEAARALSDRFDASVHLFRAVPVPPDFAAAALGTADDVVALMEADAREALGKLAAGSPRFVVEPPDMTSPQAWRAILEAAERIGADLIVVGSHGYQGWDRVLGTNAAKVADHANRPVLVVHPRRQR